MRVRGRSAKGGSAVLDIPRNEKGQVVVDRDTDLEAAELLGLTREELGNMSLSSYVVALGLVKSGNLGKKQKPK